MPPKIEEISTRDIDSRSNIKNPYSAKPKKTTIRRGPKEVYASRDHQRKGLHKPQYLGNTPLDKLFIEIEDILSGAIDEIRIENLDDKLFGGVKIEEKESREFVRRYRVIEKLLDYLIDIQRYSIESNPNDDKNLIKISLHDIKTFSKLVNLIIIHGVYPALNTFRIGIPFEKRRMNDYAKKKQTIKIDQLPQKSNSCSNHTKFEYCEKLLTLIYDKFLTIFTVDSDIKDLLLRGTGYSDFLTVSIALITVPYFESAKRAKVSSEYESLITHIPDTYELFQSYSLLLTTPSPQFFKQFVMTKLQALHYDAPRKDGLLSLIEFVLGLREHEEINVEKYSHVANVVLSKPKSVNTVVYFTNIGNQCYELLININKPIVTSCIGFVLEKLWNKNALVIQDFFLKKIWSRLNPTDQNGATVLVTESQLNNNINVLISLTNNGLSPELLKALFNPILLSVWSYYVFLKKQSRPTEVITGILVSYFTVMKDSEGDENVAYGLDIIVKNLLCEGGDSWEFKIGPNDLVEICKKPISISADIKDNKINKFLNNLDSNCEYFINILSELDDDLIQKLFVIILKRWLKVDEDKVNLSEEENPFFMLIDLRLLERIGNKFKESLAKSPLEMLEIVNSFLNASESKPEAKKSKLIVDKNSDDEDSDDEVDEDDLQQALPIVLELLSVIITESSVDLDENCYKLLREITISLRKIYQSSAGYPESTINASRSLYNRIEIILSGEEPPVTTKDMHAKILTRAVTSLNDPLVPIRAHGLYLLRQLVEQKSEVVSLEFVINLHLVQLKDPEPFIYLNVIKGLESLIGWDEKEVLKILASIYLNDSNDTELDERLKIGEVLLRYIQNANELFSGESAALIVGSTLKLIRRPSNDSNKVDNRLRMSSMSLLGLCCKTNPLGILDDLENALDCAIGILQLETNRESAIMRRSSIFLIHDLVIGTSNTKEVPFPEAYREKVIYVLKYINETDNDLLVREQARIVLNTIDELFKLAISGLEGDNPQYKGLQL